MDSNLERKEALFEAARQLASPAERAAYLDGACGNDPELRRQVEGMLADEAGAEAFFRGIDALGDSVRELAVETSAESVGQIAEGPGTVIGRYTLLERLGEGGFGVVYLAEQKEPVARQVALKIIKPGLDTREVVTRFEAERQALALMDHPNIARILDGGATETGRPYFVMDLVRGLPITEYCVTHRLAPRPRLELFIQVCQAVQHAHQKGIIHRDLKPSNVLIAQPEPGRPGEPKVIDFGIAKALNQRLTARTLVTRADQLMGTPDYMSPEQADGSGVDVDTRSDIYSLGALLYELLTGTPPFDRETVKRCSLEEIRRMIRETEPPRPSTRLTVLVAAAVRRLTANAECGMRNAELDRASLRRLHQEKREFINVLRGDLDWIVMKCLEKDRTRRYETVNGLARDLERHLNHEPVSAAAPSARYRLGKFVKRHRAGLAVAASLLAVLVAGVIVSTWQMVRARKAEQLAGKRLEEVKKQRQRAEAVSGFLVDTFRRPNPAHDGRAVTIAEVLDKAVKKLEGRFEDVPERKAAFLEALGETYHGLGLYEPAERLITESVKLRRRVLGAEHPDTLESMGRLADVYLHQDRLPEAETVVRETLATQRRVRGPEHGDTLSLMDSLASVYFRQGRLEEAAILYRETFELERRVLGLKDSRTIGAMQNLTIVLIEQKRLTDAEKLLKEALDLLRREVGPEAPCTLNAMNNLAVIFRKQGRTAESGRFNEQTLEIRRRVLGPEHPDTLSSMINLGTIYDDQGQLADAERLFAEALEIQRRVLGPAHRETRNTLGNLAETCEKLSDWDKAITLKAEMARVSGTNAPYFGQSLDTIAKGKLTGTTAKALADFADAYVEAFDKYPVLADNLDKGLRYVAAQAAALALVPRDSASGLDDVQRARLRQRALTWLRADLALWTGRFNRRTPASSLGVADVMLRWQGSLALASIREPEALKALPGEEQPAFAQLWAEVRALPTAVQQWKRDAFETLLAKGSRWAYVDDGSHLGTAWRQPDFADANWKRGHGPLGYGDDGMATEIGFGGHAGNRHVTTYFRGTLVVERPEAFSKLALRLRRDDGAVVYLNGQEIVRDNLPSEEPLPYEALALKSAGGADETTYQVHECEAALLRPGRNTIAVEVHQSERTSSDLVFDLEILGLRKK